MGWEFDVGWDPGIVRQFASWVIMARPGSPHMLIVTEGIVDALHEVMKKEYVSIGCLLYTSPSPRDGLLSRMPSSA